MAQETFEIRNRIVGLREVSRDEVHEHPKQWRVHGKEQMAVLRDLLGTIGQADVVIIYTSDTYFPGELVAIDGHGRLFQTGVERWQAIELDLTDDEADLMLAILDPTSAMAGTNKRKFEELYDSLPIQHEATQLALDDILGARMPDPSQLPFGGLNGVDIDDEGDGGEPHAEGGGLQMGVSLSAVRMAQLYLNGETHPKMMKQCDEISELIGTNNLTDTVTAAIDFAWSVLCEDIPPVLWLQGVQEQNERTELAEKREAPTINEAPAEKPKTGKRTGKKASTPSVGETPALEFDNGYIVDATTPAPTEPEAEPWVCDDCGEAHTLDQAQESDFLCHICGGQLEERVAE